MKRLILHIGTHKTGSTSLQAFLCENRGRLAQAGYDFPLMAVQPNGVKEGRNGNFLYPYVLDQLDPKKNSKNQRERMQANVQSFLSAAGKTETMILSEERIWHEGAQDERYWPVLRALFDEAGFDCVDVVVYLRRQDRFITSLWNQKVKDASKEQGTLKEYAFSDESLNAMDYGAVIEKLEGIFGREHIVVRVFDRAELVDGDIRRDFCHALNIPLDPGFAFPYERLNPGLTPAVAEVKRLINTTAEYNDVGNFLRFAAESVSALEGAPSSRLRPEDARALLDRYAAGNARIAREYLQREELFDYDPAALGSDGVEEYTQEELLRETIRFFGAALAREHDRVVQLEHRVTGLNASLGILARVRRRLWLWRRR